MATRNIGAAGLVRDLGRWHEHGESARPAYLALAEGIRLLVHDGRIPLDVTLPSERDLATVLQLSRTTITSAYTLLRERGYLISRQGARSTVALPPGAKPPGLSLGQLPSLSPTAGRHSVDGVSPIDMTFAAMGASEGMHEAYQAAIQQLPAYLSTHGMDPVGVSSLREALARRYSERGLPTDPDQLLVTVGAQHGLRLLLSVLTAPGERVLIEHPTYPNAIEAIRTVGARPVPVALRPEDPDHGWDLDGIRSAARQTAATMAYLVPDFNNPTGLVCDDAGRAALAEIARETRMTIVVDESMVDLALDCPIPRPAASFAAGSEVVTIGSASKSFWGGLRVGWIRTSRSMATRLLGTRSTMDLGTPIIDQLAATHLLCHGDQILRHRRDLLREQRSALRAALADELPDWRVGPGAGGMSLWVQLPRPVSSALAATAPNFGVLLAAGTRFGVRGAFERFVRLPYSRTPDDLALAVKAIAAAYDALGSRVLDRPAPLTVL